LKNDKKLNKNKNIKEMHKNSKFSTGDGKVHIFVGFPIEVLRSLDDHEMGGHISDKKKYKIGKL
jgi:hypothetical protein